MLRRFKTYNGTSRYKVRNPYFNGKGSFVYGVYDDSDSDFYYGSDSDSDSDALYTPLSLSVDSVHHVTCFDGHDGCITVSGHGGTPPYVYSMDSSFSNTNSTGVFDNLFITSPVNTGTDQYGQIIISTKHVYVKDADDNVVNTSVHLISPAQLDFITGAGERVFHDPGETYATIDLSRYVVLTTNANVTVTITGNNQNNQYTTNYSTNGNHLIYYHVENNCGVTLDTTLNFNIYPLFYPNAIQDGDGNWYDAVVIGDQVWTVQNMRTTSYANGQPIANGGNNVSSTTPYYYDDTSSNIPLQLRGYYYNWPAVMCGNPSSLVRSQGIAPNNWHIPTITDFSELVFYINGQSVYTNIGIGKSMVYQGYWTGYGSHVSNPSTNNRSLFGAVPAGYFTNATGFNGAQYFGDKGFSSNMWTDSEYEYDSNYAKAFKIGTNAAIFTLNAYKYCGLSVRCVYDYTPLDFVDWYLNQYGSLNHQISNP